MLLKYGMAEIKKLQKKFPKIKKRIPKKRLTKEEIQEMKQETKNKRKSERPISWELGRSFAFFAVIVFPLVRNLPCDVKRCVNNGHHKAEQRNDHGDHRKNFCWSHWTSLPSAKASGRS